MNGFEVLTKLKGNEKTVGIPVVMLTALDDDELRVSAACHYGEHYLNKPMGTKELAARIKEVLDRCGGMDRPV